MVEELQSAANVRGRLRMDSISLCKEGMVEEKRGTYLEANSTVNRTGEVEERGLKLELKAGSCCSWNRPHQTRQEDCSSQKN